jgi:hypothetical protein
MVDEPKEKVSGRNAQSRSTLTRQAGFGSLSRPVKQVSELVFSEHSVYLSESKERNEREKYDQTSGEQIIDAHLVQRCSDGSSMHKFFDGFFKNMESQDKQAKQECLIEG